MNFGGQQFKANDFGQRLDEDGQPMMGGGQYDQNVQYYNQNQYAPSMDSMSGQQVGFPPMAGSSTEKINEESEVNSFKAVGRYQESPKFKPFIPKGAVSFVNTNE